MTSRRTSRPGRSPLPAALPRHPTRAPHRRRREPRRLRRPGRTRRRRHDRGDVHKWGKPNRVDDFDGDLGDWSLYDGEGHAGNGRRSPEAASTKDGLLTINGDGDGTTAGMAWNPGQKYGRWEGRVKAPVSDPSYNALLLLWPDAENFPVGGEVDFMEMTDHTRQKTELFLHYGEDNSQVQGDVQSTRRSGTTGRSSGPRRRSPPSSTARSGGRRRTPRSSRRARCTCASSSTGSRTTGRAGVKPSEMQVDWVRQYALPEGDQGGGQGGEKKDQEDKGQDDKGGTGAEGLLEGVGGAVDHLTRRTEGAPDPVGSAQRGPSSS